MNDGPLLTARPRRLRQAAASLPPPKGQPQQARVRIEGLRQHLLSMPVENLAFFRMTHRAREVLPYLAAERGEPELALRVRLLVLAELELLRWPTLGRLLSHLWQDQELRAATRERARRTPPERPRWLARHFEAALGEDPLGGLLGAAGSTPLAQLLPALELRAGTPLAEALLDRAVTELSDAALDAQPWTATLRWIERSGVEGATRRRVLVRLLNRWLPLVPAPAWLNTPQAAPVSELIALATQRLGGGPRQRPGLWLGVSARAREVVGWARRGL